MEAAPDLSVVLVAQPNDASLALMTIKSLLLADRAGDIRKEIILVDNATPERLSDALSKLGRLICARADRACGLGEAFSYGLALARAPLVALMDGRAAVIPGWAESLVQTLASAPVGSAVTAAHVANGVTYAGFGLAYGNPYPLTPYALPAAESPTHPVPLASPHALVLSRSTLQEVGGVDAAYEDWGCLLHLSLQLRNKQRMVFVDSQSPLTAKSASPPLSDVDLERLHEIWLPRFRGFHRDLLRQALPIASATPAEKVSVVMLTDPRTPRSLAGFVAAFEHLSGSLRGHDEIVLVDDRRSPSVSALCGYLSGQHPRKVKPLRVSKALTSVEAARLGLRVASGGQAALVWGEPKLTLDQLLAQGRVQPRLSLLQADASAIELHQR